MSAKGQVSLDFLFVILALFSVYGSLNLVTNELLESQAFTSAHQQEGQIALMMARVIGSGAGFTDGAGAITFSTPQIRIPGKSAPLPCTINVAGSQVTVSYTLDGVLVSNSVDFIPPTNYDPAPGTFPATCGENITVNYTP